MTHKATTLVLGTSEALFGSWLKNYTRKLASQELATDRGTIVPQPAHTDHSNRLVIEGLYNSFTEGRHTVESIGSLIIFEVTTLSTDRISLAVECSHPLAEPYYSQLLEEINRLWPQPMKGEPMSSEHVDVLLVTVTQVEASAVLTLIKVQYGHEYEPLYIGDKTYYDLGIIGGARTFMTRSEMGSGGPGGSTTTVLEGINQLEPSAVIMVGIAFGIDSEKQSIGDVLVSTQISSYDLQRVGTGEAGESVKFARGNRSPASHMMLDRFRDGKVDWKGAPVRFGLVLSGQKLVDNLDFRNQLLDLEPEAIGGEMEGSGLFDAAYRTKTDWILVKAICDWADGRKSENKNERQQVAAENAASFVFHVLEKGGLAPAGLPTAERAMMEPSTKHLLVFEGRTERLIDRLPNLPKLEVRQAQLVWVKRSDIEEDDWVLQMELYTQVPKGQSVVIPFHRCDISIKVAGKKEPIWLELTGLWAPQTIADNSRDQIVLHQSGTMSLKAEQGVKPINIDLASQFVYVDVVLGTDRQDKIQVNAVLDPKAERIFTQYMRGNWTLQGT